MEFFDVLPRAAEEELLKRGVMTDELLYCVKADLDGEGCFFDVYITFTTETISVLSGYEIYGKMTRRDKRQKLESFEVHGYEEYSISDVEKMYVDRYVNTARLMILDKNGRDLPIARFSSGFSDKFEKFSKRVNCTAHGESIDDSLLKATELRCPKCGELYPDPNRPVCPRCTDRHSVFIRLMKMFGEFKKETIMIMVTLLLSNLLAVVAPVFSTKMLYDDVLAVGGKYYGRVLLVVIAVAMVNVAGLIIRAISGFISAKVIPGVNQRLRMKIYTAMQGLSLQYFTNKQTGSLMSRVDRDSNNIYWFFTDQFLYFIVCMVKLVGIAAVMMVISPLLSIGILIVLAVLEIVQTRFSKSQRKLYRKYDIATRSANSVLSDAMNGRRVVKAFSREDTENKRFKTRNTEAYTINRRINGRIANTIPFLNAFQSLVTHITIYLGDVMVITGGIMFGELSALINYTAMIGEPISVLSWMGNRWASCMDAASRMFEILDAKPTVKEAKEPVHRDHFKGDIELKNVSFEYEAGRPIIRNVSFKVQAGHMFGIVGKTGAGKSTIINLIARLYDVTEGEILIDGVPIKDIAFADLRRSIGIVSQETFMFIGSVADNIRYANPDATMDEVIEAAKSANAHDFITKLPEGYDTKIGEGGVTLSGGEKQRISIARAIIQKPDILILDEATAAMDTRTERRIQAAIDKLKEGRTIISIAHRLSTLRDADMLCVIENGEVREMGTHDELIRRKGKYFELYRLQADALKFIND
ncbi:MAG: ATP-binding cassette domain-containing protein [Oscillospiraceae bacterium]